METSDWFKLGVELGGTAIMIIMAAAGTITAVRIHLAIITTKMDMLERTTVDAIARVERKVDPVSREISDMGTRIALMDQRLLGLERRVDELAHGEGYTLPLYRSPYEKGKT